MARFYIWELPRWPAFAFDAAALLPVIGAARAAQGRLVEAMARIGLPARKAALLQTLTTEAMETSRIEGEHLNNAAVRASVAARLGLPKLALAPVDAQSEGIAAVMLDATAQYRTRLTKERLCLWNSLLLPGERDVVVGDWRPGPVGVYRYARVDQPPVTEYLAPPADRVPGEMQQLFDWFNAPYAGDGIVRSAIAHLWFVTVHPFEDGNGRIARAIADMALAQDEGSSQRFFSMSRRIREQRKGYYNALQQAQRGSLDVTSWIAWYLRCYARANASALQSLDRVLRTHAFWARHSSVVFNQRQKKVLTHVLHGFEGAITTKNWTRLASTSRETAQRDLSNLVDKKVLRAVGAGRSTRYEIVD